MYRRALLRGCQSCDVYIYVVTPQLNVLPCVSLECENAPICTNLGLRARECFRSQHDEMTLYEHYSRSCEQDPPTCHSICILDCIQEPGGASIWVCLSPQRQEGGHMCCTAVAAHLQVGHGFNRHESCQLQEAKLRRGRRAA